MNDDKYIGIEVLTDVLSNVTEMVDQRTTLLNSMFKEDLYNDFLMQEAFHGGMGGAGIDNVAPIAMGMPDLSVPQPPDDKEFVNVEDAGLLPSDIGDTNLTTPSGNDGNQTQTYNKGGILSTSAKPKSDNFNPQESTSSKSLEETGFDDVIERNISNLNYIEKIIAKTYFSIHSKYFKKIHYGKFILPERVNLNIFL